MNPRRIQVKPTPGAPLNKMWLDLFAANKAITALRRYVYPTQKKAPPKRG